MNTKNTPILLLTGFLGSGKTTLVNRILSNRQGIKFAVMVNDIGEVNIDADLIQKGGVVNQEQGNLVTLENGCVCCSLQMDLINQLNELHAQQFDYIVLEASGLGMPAPIAQNICSIPQMQAPGQSYPYLDCIVTMVDALRLQSPLEEDLQALVVEQIEFCNIVLLNKADLVSAEQLAETKAYIRALQAQAEIIETSHADIELDTILDTHLFRFDKVATSAAWIREMERPLSEAERSEAEHHEHHHHHHDEDCPYCRAEKEHHHEHHHHDCDGSHHAHEEHCDCHEHHHEHDCHCHEHEHEHHHHDCNCHEHEHEHHHEHHHHEAPFGIETFLYYRRGPFDMNKFDYFVTKQWPKEILRAKGLCWFEDNPDMSCIFEQAGEQKQLTEGGYWYAAAPPQEWMEIVAQDPKARDDWDEKYGDRMQKIVFIGKHLDKHHLIHLLDNCLASE